jgi:hypothetical protein
VFSADFTKKFGITSISGESLSNGAGGSDDKKKKLAIGLGVGLGVGIPLILLIIFLIWRRQRAAGQVVSPGQSS